MGMGKLKTVGMIGLGLGALTAVISFLAPQAPGQGQPRVVPTAAAPKVVVSGPPASPNDVADWVAGWPELTNPPDNSPKSKAILKALEQPLAMNFPTDTPLSDVIKYIQDATQSPELPKGLIIYVDPIGLQDSDKTLADTVMINLEDVPLKTTLSLLLRQLSLYYRVKDGLMIISSTASDDFVTPFTIMEEKARTGELSREQYRQLIEALKLKKQVESLASDQ